MNKSNKNPRLLLIQLYGDMQPPDAEPLSVEVLAAAILTKYPLSHTVIRTIDIYNSNNQINSLIVEINSLSPIVIGISVPQSTFDLSIQLIKGIYQTNPYAKIILGHALPTYAPDIFLQPYPDLIIVRGWGDECFVQLIEYFYEKIGNLENIPNLCFLKEGTLFFTNLKWPAKIIMPIRYKPELYFSRIEASRGCHYNICTFCTRQPRNKKLESPWKRRKIPDILDDIQNVTAQGKSTFTFTDEDFIGEDIEGAKKIAEGLRLYQGIQFSISVRVDNIINPSDTAKEKDQRHSCLELLRDSGLYFIFMGVESFSNSQLIRYGKHITTEDCINSIREIQRLGIRFEIGFILFDPFLSINELSENIQVIDEKCLWTYIGQIFNHLRPQKDSSYLTLLNKSNLIGKYNPETLSYDCSFLNKDVCQIFTEGNNWMRNIDPIYLLARNIARTGYYDDQYSHFVLGYRSLSFRYLQFLANNIRDLRNDDFQDKKGRFDIEINSLIQDLFQAVIIKEKYIGLDETENLLKRECNLYLYH